MKHITLFIAALCLSLNTFAQLYVAPPEDIAAFYKSETLVVLEDAVFSDYNAKIQEVVENHWTITPYKFINMSDFDEYKKNPKYSFLMKAQVNFFRQDKIKAKYYFMSLTLGDPNMTTYDDMATLAGFPLSYLDDDDQEKYAYKMRSAILFIQRHIEIVKNKPDLNKNNIVQHYNRNQSNVNDKTLYLLKSDLEKDIQSMKKIKKVYAGQVKFVSMDEIAQAIDNQDEKVVFLHKVGPGKSTKKARCWKMILGAADGRLYYYDHHRINNRNPDGLLEKDLKKLKRQ